MAIRPRELSLHNVNRQSFIDNYEELRLLAATNLLQPFIDEAALQVWVAGEATQIIAIIS
jgi:hypothetical protein